MLNTHTIANTFILLGIKEHIGISPMKLQKLTYFLYKEYLQRTNEKLFNEPFEKWKYGPVLPSLYYEFSSFGANPINRFFRNAKGQAEIIDLDFTSALSKAVKKVWNIYKSYSAVELSSLTHEENTAWSKAVNYILSDEDIKNERELL
ncbi:MAG: DUF4065 domain-containing protein [Ruminococcus sp.]|nr:DUF4065 domain-containing protein [Ruminococcus sp.]